MKNQTIKIVSWNINGWRAILRKNLVEVVQKLEQAGGEIDQIKMFLIGYKWENIQDTGVVDLIPQWYLKYGETWYTYDKLYEKIVEEKGRGNGF